MLLLVTHKAAQVYSPVNMIEKIMKRVALFLSYFWFPNNDFLYNVENSRLGGLKGEFSCPKTDTPAIPIPIYSLKLVACICYKWPCQMK